MTRRKSVKVWTWRRALRDHGPSHPGLLLTLHTIGTWMDGDGFCHPGQKAIAKGSRCSERTVRRHIEQAVELGWLHVESVALPDKGKGWRRNEYYATVPSNVELSDTDEELTDCLHSQMGDVGEDYDDAGDDEMGEGADTIMSSRSGNVSPKVRTSDAKVRTSGTEGEDTGDHIVGTQYCPHNSPLNSPIELSSTEGRARARPLASPDSQEGREEVSTYPHWRPNDRHEQPEGLAHFSDILADSTIESLQGENGAEPAAISESRRRRILELAGYGYGTLAIAKMAGVEQLAVEKLIREAAA